MITVLRILVGIILAFLIDAYDRHKREREAAKCRQDGMDRWNDAVRYKMNLILADGESHAKPRHADGSTP